VILRTLHVRLYPVDLNPERFDPRLQLLDRHGVEILLCKGDKRIVGLARKQVVQIHGWNRLTAQTPLSISREHDWASLLDARVCGELEHVVS
jgi:hypothetical protein